MSQLTVYSDGDAATPLFDTAEAAAITADLAQIGVRLERWPADQALAPDADEAAVLEAYGPEIDRLRIRGGYQAVDAIRVTLRTQPETGMRDKFLHEHIHDDDEVRFFVEGSGMFYLRAKGQVRMVLCEAGDLIGVPAGLRHWFDIGPRPRFTVIRLFTAAEGWVARFTGDAIAGQFPAFEPAG